MGHSYPMIKAIAKTLVALNSNIRKEQIASGFAWGVLLALLPAGNLLWVFLFLISLFFKNNYGTQLLSMGLLKLLVPLAAVPLDALGWIILTAPALQGLFTALYNLPLAPLTRFNNTLTAGGLAAGIVLWVPVFFAVRSLVPLYRNTLAPRIAQSWLYKGFIKLPLVSALTKAVSSASNAVGVLK